MSSADKCPAGGEHEWTDEVDERYGDRLSRQYLEPKQRWHCIECGAPMQCENAL